MSCIAGGVLLFCAMACAQQPEFLALKQRLDQTPVRPKPGRLAAEMQQQIEQHPGDPRYVYLFGRSLIGKDTPEALSQLKRAAAMDPKLPWVYQALADIYASKNFRDDEKLVAAMAAFRALRPDDVEGFRNLDRVRIPAEAGEWARQLRALLEARDQTADVHYWSLLWAAEFRAATEAGYPALRKRVAEDLKKLEPMQASASRTVLETLLEGYNLSADPFGAKRISQRLNADEEMGKTYDQWIAKYRANPRKTPEEQAAFNVEYAKAAEEWVQRWPDSHQAWDLRVMTLANLPGASRAEIEIAGETEVRLDADRKWWNWVPVKMRVAQYWLRAGIRTEDCVQMAEEALAEISLGPDDSDDLGSAANTRAPAFPFDNSMWDAMIAVMDGSLRLHNLDKAGRMLARMQQWLDDNAAKKNEISSGYSRFQGRYLHYVGAVAEVQGHKTDALGFYVASLNAGLRPADEVKHAQEMWEQAGGTAEGWAALTHRPPPAPAPPRAPQPAISVATAAGAWTDFGKPLGNLSLRDAAGRTWTPADFQGKVTLVNLWATWCAPCREELPQLQKLYEMVKDRRDVQVVTLNVDDDAGDAAGFMKGHGYTFPALFNARVYVDGIVKPLSLPRNWLVDAKGVARQQVVGFDTKALDWAGEVLAKLLQLQ